MRAVAARLNTLDHQESVEMISIYVIESDDRYRQGLVDLFSSQSDFKLLGSASTLADAVEPIAQSNPELILLDDHLLSGSNNGSSQAVFAQKPDTMIVLLTDQADNARLFAALGAGAKGYLLKSVEPQGLLAALRGLQQGQAPISRSMVAQILEEFSRLHRLASPDGARLEQLTAREFDVLRELSQGLTNREIAAALYISEYTVKNHLHNILDKLKVSNRREAIQFAKKHGLSSPEREAR